MTNPQTEARAIYERGISAGGQFSIVDEIATALAAKDAELADLQSRYNKALVDIDAKDYRAERAEAQLAEANKALDAIIERSHNDPLGTSKVNDMREIARRAREAQGGE